MLGVRVDTCVMPACLIRRSSMRVTPVLSRSRTVLRAIAMALSSLMVLTSLSAQSNKDSDKIAKKLTKLKRIDHIIVIYQENWSFDSLYGLFPDAVGLANAST